MHAVAENGSVEMLEAFVVAGGDIEFIFRNEAPIICALKAKKIDNAVWLVEKGCDVDVTDTFRKTLVEQFDAHLQSNKDLAARPGCASAAFSEEELQKRSAFRATLVAKMKK